MSDTHIAIAVASMSDIAALLPRRLALLSGARRPGEADRPAFYTSPPAEVSLPNLKDRLSEPLMAWMRGVIPEVVASR
ncbi:hypothetical protein [Phenylobacterium sp.]|uniref:hypothetical protein n=1 Tax=Phenylobacterium sp. TaxID=1871053 RepID=UPI0027370B3F|nr:hypothetical protein [Phenylobacterium sp.]MDP3659402.1 hypothetical protein [Phenylobacterium sp.]